MQESHIGCRSVNRMGVLAVWRRGATCPRLSIILPDAGPPKQAGAADFPPEHGAVEVLVPPRRGRFYGSDDEAYWYIEKDGAPEPSTFGDALVQVERALLEADPPVDLLLGKGQGGVLALCLARLWPERIAAVATLDARLSNDVLRLPLQPRPLEGLPIYLFSRDGGGDATTRRILAEENGRVRVGHAVDLSSAYARAMDALNTGPLQ
jgi:pimeloyl-ACP methyl ester carboxylesterase